MNQKLALILMSTCFAANAYDYITAYTYDGELVLGPAPMAPSVHPEKFNLIYRPIPDNGITDKFIDTSGLFSSPKSVREYGKMWASDANALLQKFAKEVPELAACSTTNETAAAELREIYEFLLSPNSPEKNMGRTRSKRAELILNGHIIASGGLPANERFNAWDEAPFWFYSVDEESADKLWVQGYGFSVSDITDDTTPIGISEMISRGVPKLNKACTNTIIGIARALDFTIQRRHIEFGYNHIIMSDDNGLIATNLVYNRESEAFLNTFFNEKFKPKLYYKPRLESDYNERRVLQPFMREVFYTEGFIAKTLQAEFMILRHHNAEGLPELVDQVAQIADISEKGVLMLREAAGLNPDGTPKESNGSSE